MKEENEVDFALGQIADILRANPAAKQTLQNNLTAVIYDETVRKVNSQGYALLDEGDISTTATASSNLFVDILTQD